MGDRKSGIYLILNKTTAHFYIGRSNDIRKRINSHISYLNRGIHPNELLSRDWENGHHFQFSILLIASTDSLPTLEQHFLNTLKPQYNIATHALASMAGRNHSEATKQTISKKLTGRRHSAEARAKMRASRKSHDHWLGKHHSSETKQQISATRLRNPFVCSPETRRKISETRQRIPVVCSNGKTYLSQLDAAKDLGVRVGHISEVISGKRPTAGGYRFWRKNECITSN